MLPRNTYDQLLTNDHNYSNLKVILKIQANRARNYLENLDLVLGTLPLECIEREILEHTGLRLGTHFIKKLCLAFPIINVEVWQNGMDTETRSLILDCLSVLLVGTEFKDTDEFKALLKSQASEVFK